MRIFTALILLSSFANAKGPIKQIDLSIKFLVDLVKTPPLFPKEDISLSFKMAKTFKKLTGTQTPTKQQLRDAVSKLPQSHHKNNVMNFLSSEVASPPHPVQTQEFLNNLILLANASSNHHSNAKMPIWKMPMAVESPFASTQKRALEFYTLEEPGVAYIDLHQNKFAAAWNMASFDVRKDFLKKYDFVYKSRPLHKSYEDKFIFNSKHNFKLASNIELDRLSNLFKKNEVYNSYLLASYVLEKKYSEKMLQNIYSDMAAREWSHLESHKLEFIEAAHDIKSFSSFLYRRKAYIDLAIEQLREMKPEIRDPIIKDYSLWKDKVDILPNKFKKQVVKLFEGLDFESMDSKPYIDPIDVLIWEAELHPQKPYTKEFRDIALHLFYEMGEVAAAKRLKMNTKLLLELIEEHEEFYSYDIRQIAVWLKQNINTYTASKEMNIPPRLIDAWAERGVKVGDNEDALFTKLNEMNIKSIIFIKRESQFYTLEQKKEIAVKLYTKLRSKIVGRLLGESAETIEQWMQEFRDLVLKDASTMSLIEVAKKHKIHHTTVVKWKHRKASEYPEEKRIDALKLAGELNSIEDAAKRLGLDPHFIKNWMKQMVAKHDPSVMIPIIGIENASREYGIPLSTLRESLNIKKISAGSTDQFDSAQELSKYSHHLNSTAGKTRDVLAKIPKLGAKKVGEEYGIPLPTLWRMRCKDANSPRFTKGYRQDIVERANRIRSDATVAREENLDKLYISIWRKQIKNKPNPPISLDH